MGVILDSSVLIAAERRGQTMRQTLSGLADSLGDVEIAVSVITLTELAHGAARAETDQRKERRIRYIQELIVGIPVQPVTASIAFRAGLLDGENQARGVRLPLSDLLIGVTALELGYDVGTSNLRHFQLISGLGITQI